MDEISGSIRSVQFRRELRGYSLDDVDAFVARVADRVDQLLARAEAAERAATERPNDDPDDSLRRTLVLAQRTADLAIQEARQEAADLVAAATAERDAVLSGVQAESQRRREEAEGTLRGDVERLAELRGQLTADTEALEAWVAQERARVRSLLAEQLEVVDAGGPSPSPKPTFRAPEDVPASMPDDARDDLPEHRSLDTTTPDEPPEVRPMYDGDDEAETRVAGGLDDTPASPDDRDHDAFLAELRRAADDDEPLGPRDDVLASALTPDRVPDAFVDEDEVGRFGSRRRRRR